MCMAVEDNSPPSGKSPRGLASSPATKVGFAVENQSSLKLRLDRSNFHTQRSFAHKNKTIEKRTVCDRSMDNEVRLIYNL